MAVNRIDSSSRNERGSHRAFEGLFSSVAWFENLRACGFIDAPQCLEASLMKPDGEVRLLLMQKQPGEGLASLSNYYSCLYGPVGPVSGLSEDDWRAVARTLRSLPGSDVVQLQPLDAASEWLPRLESGLRAERYWTSRFFSFGNWYQPVAAGGFDPYWTDRPSALRHSVERGRRRLDKAGTWRIDIVCNETAELEVAIGAYQAVYAQSWKNPEPCPDFMPGLIRTAAREGWLRLGVLWLNGNAVAAQVWLVADGKANIYKLAYVKGMEKLSVGSVLTAALMQQVMDVDQVQEVDYLIGDEAYKADWMALRRERVGLVAFDRRSWRGWLAAARHFLGRWSRRLRPSA